MLDARARNVCCSAQRVRAGSILLHNTEVWVLVASSEKHLLQRAEHKGLHSTTASLLQP